MTKQTHTPEDKSAEGQAAHEAAAVKLEAQGQRILASYPNAPEVYMTSDGFGFFGETDARNHATTLRNKTVTTVKQK